MKADFRDRVASVGDAALKVIGQFLGGKKVDPLRVKIAAQMSGQAIRVEHMNQVADQQAVSQAIRIAGLLGDPAARTEYIASMGGDVVTMVPLPKRLVTARKAKKSR